MTTTPDTVSRTAYTLDQALDHAVQDTDAKIARTDSKASLLLAFTGAVLAGLASMAGAPMPPVTAALGGTAVLALVAAAVLLLLVVRPRLGGTDRASFPYWAGLRDDASVLDSMTGDTRPARIRVMSVIATRKFVFLQRAVDTILAALALLLLAALSALI